MNATATIPPPNPATPLMTAEEFLRLYGDESNVELVKGRVVRYPMPGGKHGKICGKAYLFIVQYVMEHDLGHVMTNDTFVRVGTDPDAFRGADVCYISYSRLPKEMEVPDGPIPSPELVVEVRSPTDKLHRLAAKASEYLDAGVTVVVVLDPEAQMAIVHRTDEVARYYSSEEVLTLADVLPGFATPVRAFFE